MEKLMKALEERNIPKRFKIAVTMAEDFVSKDKTPEEIEKLKTGAIKEILMHEMKHDEELADLFAHYACETAIDNVVKALDIKPGKTPVSDAFKELFEALELL